MENNWKNIDENKQSELAAALLPGDVLKERLQRNDRGQIAQTIENCELVVREDSLLKDAVKLNLLTGRMEITKEMPWRRAGPVLNDNDMDNILSHMGRSYALRNDRLCRRAISTAAHENGYHPIREVLNALEWDGEARICHALHHFLGAPDDALTHQCLKMFMIGALRRIFEPGCKFEYVLTLVGGQGLGKSTFFRFLSLQDDWFTDDMVGFKSSRIFEKLAGHWIIEMSEMLTIMNAKGADEIKAFLSRQVDVYRDPYAVFPADRPRQCVFGATTNRQKCLPFDRTGNRRFLPVAVDPEQADVHILDDESVSRAYFRQLWAEAMRLYCTGNYSMRFSQEIERQLKKLRCEFMAEDTNAGQIQAYLENFEGDHVCTVQLYREALGNAFGEPSRRDSLEVGDIMRNAIDGWQSGPMHRFPSFGLQRSWVRVDKVCKQSDQNSDEFIDITDTCDLPFETDSRQIPIEIPANTGVGDS